ncbi:hypothetical protein [uncultured Amphritea sp.]|uniref:hypothetical protein n=1 Tax=uncultured Amphritea sp. TaxID=981605 RepID=UPI0025DCF1AF|nr:hypothetical protein [uncultured Amphritea sp.]
MFSIESLKYFFIVVTSALGIFGTFYDFKDSGRVNNKGRLAVAVLVILAVASIVTEILSNKDSYRKAEIAAEQLSEENKQRDKLIVKSQNIEKSIIDSVNQLKILKQELSDNNKAIESAELNLKKLSEIQLAQQIELNKDIGNFKSATELELKRLSSPLDALYVSTNFKFMNPSEHFSEYYKLLIPEFYSGDGLYVLSEKNVPADIDLSKMYYFSPDRIKFNVYSNMTEDSFSFERLKSKMPELSFTSAPTKRKLSFFEMYSNVEEKNIIRILNRTPIKLESSSGKFTSSLDITDLSAPGDYIVFSFSSIYDNDVKIEYLELHTKDSPYVGVRLNNCSLIEKQGGLTVHMSNSKKFTHYNYRYACELWVSEKLEKGFWL